MSVLLRLIEMAALAIPAIAWCGGKAVNRKSIQLLGRR